MRICIGTSLCPLQIHRTLATLAVLYECELVGPEHEWRPSLAGSKARAVVSLDPFTLLSLSGLDMAIFVLPSNGLLAAWSRAGPKTASRCRAGRKKTAAAAICPEQDIKRLIYPHDHRMDLREVSSSLPAAYLVDGSIVAKSMIEPCCIA